ncbi:hypothetical protein IR215_25635 [Simulacricoccus sp. 17bor-14]|nr:hypothetical protein [Simulacricoccus sp. 17bor-14]
MRVELRAVRLRQRPLQTLLAPALLGLGLLGCNDLQVCGSHTEPVLEPDGGSFRCIQSEDCPRGSRVFVCTTDVSSERECVKCEDSNCVTVVPEACQ